MPGERRRELWTNRETILSSDLARVGKLVNKETQDAEMLRSSRADFYDPATNTGGDFAASLKTLSVPTPGLLRAPSIEPVAGTFNVTLGAGEGETMGPGVVIADESEYQLSRWSGQVLTWPVDGQPNPSNPRICLIIATPADVSAEQQSRNILVNPDTRETSPATVYKLSVPVATISVVSGTAGAAPQPPACPAGALPLFEVIVPAGATDSTSYQFVRRSGRRIEFPGTSQHGIVKGCVPDLIGTIGVESLTCGLPGGVVHRLAIDGELLTWKTTNQLRIRADLTTPPTAAPAGNDMATYLYLCGGRNSPMRDQGAVASVPNGDWAPVVLVESLTAPDAMGYPSAGLSIQWGAGTLTIARGAACYIGPAFRVANTTGLVPVVYDGDWARIVGNRGLVQPDITTAAPTYASISMPTLPATSTVVSLKTWFSGSNSTLVSISRSDSDSYLLDTLTQGAVHEAAQKAQATLYYKGLVTGDTLYLRVRGCNMNVPRLSR